MFLPTQVSNFFQQHNAWGAPVGLVGKVTSREGGREEPHAPYSSKIKPQIELADS